VQIGYASPYARTTTKSCILPYTQCTGCLSSPKRYYQLGWQMKPVFYRRLAGKSCWMALGQYEHIDNQAGDAMDLWPDFV
jgi:hypothetical protein